MSVPSGGRGLMMSWHCCWRSISGVGTSEAITRSDTPGACWRRRCISAGSSTSRWKSITDCP